MIDWHFISELEGSRLVGYVPAADSSNSGVTIASGVDLGQISSAELAMLPGALQAKLLPYVGLRRASAVLKLSQAPLAITADEAATLDRVVEGAHLAPLQSQYCYYAGRDFDALPDAVQTVAASVSFQYGEIWRRCPKFWSSLIRQNFPEMIAELNNFGDQYGTRRRREATYLGEHLAHAGPG